MQVLTGNETCQAVASMRERAVACNEHILVTRVALARLLDRHASGQVTAAELVDLANALESNDEVDYEQDAEAAISEVLFELASPEINGELTIERTRALRDALLASGATDLP